MSGKKSRESFMTELREGFRYTATNHFALTILIMNVIWATGGDPRTAVHDLVTAGAHPAIKNARG